MRNEKISWINYVDEKLFKFKLPYMEFFKAHLLFNFLAKL